MNTTVFDYFTFNMNNSYDVCSSQSPNDVSFVSFYIVIIGILILCNSVLLSGIAISWRVLKQNIVYSYLISCILSEICFCLASAYQIYQSEFNGESDWVTGGTLQRYDKDNTVHRSVMQNYAFRKGLIVSLVICREFNICALIYAVSHNVQFVGRYSELVLHNNSKQRQNTSKIVKCFQRKKCKAAYLIAMTWTIPIGLSLPVAFDWNCVEYCMCLPAIRLNTTCYAPVDSDVVCSRQWLPLINSFIIVITSCYICGLAIMFVMLARTIRKFRKAYTPKKPRVNFTASRRKRIGEINALGRRTSRGKLKSSLRELDTIEKHQDEFCEQPGGIVAQISVRRTPGLAIDISNLAIPTSSTHETSYSPITTLPRSKRRPPLHSTIKLLIVLTTSFLISVTPLVCVLFIDVVFPESEKMSNTIFMSAIAVSYLQAASLPFILLKYMRGLRKACVNILLKCPCLYTTIVEQKPRDIHESSASDQIKKTKNKQVVPCEVPKVPQQNPPSYNTTVLTTPCDEPSTPYEVSTVPQHNDEKKHNAPILGTVRIDITSAIKEDVILKDADVPEKVATFKKSEELDEKQLEPDEITTSNISS